MSGIISLDTNIFIYYFHQSENFGEKAKIVFEQLAKGKKKAVTSIISFIEFLSLKTSDKNIDFLKDLFLQTPNLSIYDVNQEIGSEAARIRREYSFRLPDSIQLATALYGKADIFITNDAKFQKFDKIKVILLRELKQTLR